MFFFIYNISDHYLDICWESSSEDDFKEHRKKIIETALYLSLISSAFLK